MELKEFLNEKRTKKNLANFEHCPQPIIDERAQPIIYERAKVLKILLLRIFGIALVMHTNSVLSDHVFDNKINPTTYKISVENPHKQMV